MVGYLVFLTILAGLFAIFALGLNLQWGRRNRRGDKFLWVKLIAIMGPNT